MTDLDEFASAEYVPGFGQQSTVSTESGTGKPISVGVMPLPWTSNTSFGSKSSIYVSNALGHSALNHVVPRPATYQLSLKIKIHTKYMHSKEDIYISSRRSPYAEKLRDLLQAG